MSSFFVPLSSRLVLRNVILSAAVPCLAGVLVMIPAVTLHAQDAAAPASAAQDSAAPAAAAPQQTAPPAVAIQTGKTRESKKDSKVVQSKDTKRIQKRAKKTDPLEGVASKLPDKQLYDKAQIALKKGKFDVARLELQTLLNTYPDSQFQMRAKLAVADSWYKEGGTAALTQAEAEYKDFETFFPNVPEAAEAQMRIADIYYRQMDKPDRDFTKVQRAQEEYRAMIQQYPDSTLVPRAKQQLRQVQEVMATREAGIAAFYAGHENWAASIARYQTLVDSFPLYSHIDDALIGLGDAYASEARIVSGMKLPEGPKARLEKIYNDQAAAAYSRVITRYPAAAHADDARDRLTGLNYPVPTPTAAAMANSEAEEQSRALVTLRDRALIMILRRPDVVSAARIGEPTLIDPKKTLAPEITKQTIAAFQSAINPVQAGSGPQSPALAAPTASDVQGTPSDASATAQPAAPAAPLQLQDVPTAAAAGSTGSVVTSVPVTGSAAGSSAGSTGSSGGSGTSLEVVSPGSPAPTGSSVLPTTAADPTGGLKPVGPTDNALLPPVEKPAAAPDQVNDVTTPAAAQAQTAARKKQPKPAYDSNADSSSKHKKKKGLGKLNPF